MRLRAERLRTLGDTRASAPDSAISAGATGASVGLAQAGDLNLVAAIAPNPVAERATITMPNVPANGWSINVMDPHGKGGPEQDRDPLGKIRLGPSSLGTGYVFRALG